MKHVKFTMGAAALVLIGASGAAHASLIGSDVIVTRVVQGANFNPVTYNPNHFNPRVTVTVGPGVEVVGFADFQFGTFDIQASSIVCSFNTSFTNNISFGNFSGSNGFNGVVFSLPTGGQAEFLAASLTQLNVVTGTPVVSFLGRHLFLNLNGVALLQSSLPFASVGVSAVVPAPGAAALAGLALAGAVRRRRR